MAPANNKPQIVIICDTVPYPARSGDNQRIAELIRTLREQGWYVHLLLCGFVDRKLRALCRHHVDALHIYGGVGWKTRIRNGARHAVRFADRAGAVIGAPPLEDLARRVLGRAVTPLILDYWKRYPTGLDAYVARLSNGFPWKAAIVEYIWLHQALDKMRDGVLCLLDTHDIQHRRVTEFASRGMSFPLRISRAEEARIFEKFDAVIAIQAAEAKLIEEMCPGIRVITAGSCGAGIASASHAPEHGRMLYVGGYNGANIDGLRRFLNEIWPRVRGKVAQASLRVCGHVYRAFIGQQFENVTFAGHTENLEREYAEASIVINPVWIGTGLKIKTVEALARGKPLVTTLKGIEGLPESVLSGAWVANDDAGFADALIRLNDDQSARQALSQSAAEFARVHLNKQAVYRELFDFLQKNI